MKAYIKPELERIVFVSEVVTTPTGDGKDVSIGTDMDIDNPDSWN